MKQLAVVLAAIAVSVMAYIGVAGYRNEPEKPTGQRANQTAGVSTSGVDQQMPERQGRDVAGAEERGTRAQELLATGTGKSALNEEQRQQIAALMSKQPRVAGADPGSLSISIGASVPRQVPLQPLPPEVVNVMKKFQGDEYLIAAGKLLIVEPKVRRIVAVIPLS